MGGLLPRLGFAIGALVVASTALMVAFGFIGGAIFFELRTGLSPAAASVVTACFLLLIALFAALIGWIAWHWHDRSRASLPASVASNPAVALGDVIGREALSFAKASPKQTVGLALIAGFVIGAVPEIHKLIGRAAGLGEPRR